MRDGSPGALQSVRISDAHTAYAKVLLNTLDRVCPPQPGNWWGSQLPEQGTQPSALSSAPEPPSPCPHPQRQLYCQSRKPVPAQTSSTPAESSHTGICHLQPRRATLLQGAPATPSSAGPAGTISRAWAGC